MLHQGGTATASVLSSGPHTAEQVESRVARWPDSLAPVGVTRGCVCLSCPHPS